MEELKKYLKEHYLVPRYSFLTILIASFLGFSIRGAKIDYIINLILYMWSINQDSKRYIKK